MLLNEKDVRLAEQRRQELRHEANQERLAKASRPSRTDRKSKPQNALLARIWLLF
jgi:hypothetical protein